MSTIDNKLKENIPVESTSLDRTSKLVVRENFWSFIPFINAKPIIEVSCDCGNKYKAKLLYLASSAYEGDQDIRCAKCKKEEGIYVKGSTHVRYNQM
jgi:hypothetical protein